MDGHFLHAMNGDWDSLLTGMRENRQVAQRTDASGMTVLHWVCLHQEAPTDIVVKVVFANPYAVHMRNDAGHLPIDLAVQAECGERILEVLRAAARGKHRPENSSNPHELKDCDDREGTTDTIDYQLPDTTHTIVHPDTRKSLEYPITPNHTYYEEAEEDVDNDELEYQPFQQHKGRLERSYYNVSRGKNGVASPYASFHDSRDRTRESILRQSDPHVQSLLTEQRLRERENDLISIATADDSMPFGMFDPLNGTPNKFIMPGDSMNHDDQSRHVHSSVTSRSAGPRSQTAFPPRWKQSSMCHVCACAFSLVKRRHHCRNCGHSVCSQHSINRVALPKFALSEPQRVCDQCFLSGHHIMGSGGRTPSIVSSYQSLPAQVQREQRPEPFQPTQPYHVQF